jgi:citrate lyase beta subunit
MLFVSGEKTDRFAKALASGADLVCIDLEDAVHPDRKAEARAQVLAWLLAHPPRPGEARRALRLNGLRTSEGLHDVLALQQAGVDAAAAGQPLALQALLLPKVEAAAELQLALAWLAPCINTAEGGVVALLETPTGVAQAAAIAAAAPGVLALMLGGADLSVELDAQFGWEGLRHARGALVNAAKAAGVQAWDVPHIDLADTPGLLEETRRVLALGFNCKTAIHPQQIAPIHQAFAPTADELAWARLLLQAVPEGGASGAFLFQGRMVDAPLLRKAQRFVQRAAQAGL